MRVSFAFGSKLMPAFKTLLFLSITGVAAWPAEQAILRSGFSIRCQSHTSDDDFVYLQTGTGVVTIKATEVEGFEAELSALPEAAVEVKPIAIVTPPQFVKPVLNTKQLIETKANAYGIPASFVHSVVMAESAYNVNALSPKGAIGLMQLMPATAKSLGVDPKDPEQNVDAGVRHLTDLLLRFKDDPEQVRKALAAYNAGVGAVDKYRGVPPYPETQMYVEKILHQYNNLRK